MSNSYFFLSRLARQNQNVNTESLQPSDIKSQELSAEDREELEFEAQQQKDEDENGGY